MNSVGNGFYVGFFLGVARILTKKSLALCHQGKETVTSAKSITDFARLWGAVRKNIISDRFSTKTAISAHI